LSIVTYIKKLAHSFSYNTGFSVKDLRNYKNFKKIKNSEINLYRDSLLLRTMQKSGSHLFLSSLGNYVNLQYNNNVDRLDYPTLKRVIWDNDWSYDNHVLSNTGYKSFIFRHDFEARNRYILSSKRIINLYRNPFDMCVSLYFYDCKNRNKTKGNEARFKKYKGIDSPVDFMDIFIDRYISSYQELLHFSKYDNVVNYSYEELVTDTFSVLQDTLEFCDIEIDEKKLSNAILFSSREKMIEDEDKYGKTNLVGRDMNSSFIRSGKIGEWKEYFSDQDFLKFADILLRDGISVDKFILE